MPNDGNDNFVRAMIRLLENLDRIPPADPRLDYIKNCTRCNLSPHLGLNPDCHRVVTYSGNLQALVLCILMAPAKVEDKYGWPCIGPSNILMDWFEDFGFSRYKTFAWANAVLCRLPDSRKRARATQDELDACKFNLSQIIDLMPNLQLILSFGWDATKAVEGRNCTVGARLFNIGKIGWIPAAYQFKKGRKFLVWAGWHPAYLLRKKGTVRQVLERKFRSSLGFVAKIIRELEAGMDVERFKPPDTNIILDTPERAYQWADWQLSDNRITSYTKDYETLGKWGRYNTPIGVSYAYENPDTSLVEAVWIPFKKCVDLPKSEWHKVRMAKHKGHFTMKWKWEPWFDQEPDFEQKFMQKMRHLEDTDFTIPGRGKPAFNSWQSSFEWSATRGEYGFDMCGSDRQLGLEAWKTDTIKWDGLPAFRSVINSNSMKLESILELCMPMVANEKMPATNLVKKLVGEHGLDATGFGILARKLPEDIPVDELRRDGKIYTEWLASMNHEVGKKVKKEKKLECPLSSDRLELIEKIWSPEYEDFYSSILGQRACTDSRYEYMLNSVYNELAFSEEEMASDQIANRNFDELFFDNRFEEYMYEVSGSDLSPEIL